VFADAAYTGLVRRAGAELDVTIGHQETSRGDPTGSSHSSRCGGSSGPSPGSAATAGSATTTKPL
jgi:hypothetical protein